MFFELIKIKPKSRLVLVGDGKNRQEIENIVEKFGLTEKVDFTGSVTNVPELLQAMDVMILPSLHEGMPLVTIEWQMAGLPCLLSDKVTKECAFTDLVRFKSLKSSYKEWAQELLDINVQVDIRVESSQIAIKKAKEVGFDINMNVVELQQYFIEHCHSQQGYTNL